MGEIECWRKGLIKIENKTCNKRCNKIPLRRDYGYNLILRVLTVILTNLNKIDNYGLLQNVGNARVWIQLHAD